MIRKGGAASRGGPTSSRHRIAQRPDSQQVTSQGEAEQKGVTWWRCGWRWWGQRFVAGGAEDGTRLAEKGGFGLTDDAAGVGRRARGGEVAAGSNKGGRGGTCGREARRMSAQDRRGRSVAKRKKDDCVGERESE